MTHVQSSSTEWLPVSVAPDQGELEICVVNYDGIVRALDYPLRRSGAAWVDASNTKLLDIQPTHWRKWTARH